MTEKYISNIMGRHICINSEPKTRLPLKVDISYDFSCLEDFECIVIIRNTKCGVEEKYYKVSEI